ncbi:MAG: HlyD family secretion protein [Acidobacteria bacterium]|jgi:membrane fusion protein, multidrug efflux system|nr:HlyD family secretion protein [Acidobacteriota bacterium]
MKKWIGLAVILLFIGGGVVTWFFYWKNARLYPSTEDAYVAGDVYQISSRIPGTVLTLDVDDNQPVAEGQVVATIDPEPYDSEVDQARAALAQARTVPATNRAKIAQAKADVEAAASDLELARADLARFTELVQRNSIPKRAYDQAVAAEQVAAARLAAKQKAQAAAEASLDVSEKDVKRAETALAAAQLRRSYCTIRVPVAGIVSESTAHEGQVVAPGQPLFAVVPLHGDHLWIEANFKETQLARIRPGQPVSFYTDVNPDQKYHGTVESLSAGTGAAFSLLPPENATGNWVKVVQRLPVRIAVDPASAAGQTLRLGLSVHVTVDTAAGDRSGPEQSPERTEKAGDGGSSSQ